MHQIKYFIQLRLVLLLQMIICCSNSVKCKITNFTIFCNEIKLHIYIYIYIDVDIDIHTVIYFLLRVPYSLSPFLYLDL